MLRFMSLNLNYRVPKHGKWKARRTLIADAVRQADVDVVALQAVERVDGCGQAAELAALLGYEHVTFVAAMKGKTATRGSAFIARRQLADLAVHRLNHLGNHEDGDRRIVLKTGIETAVGHVDLYNAHFSWVQTQALNNARETVAFRTPGPSLLCGDLNSAPDSAAVETLRRAGWTDVWASLRPNDPGWTFESDRPTQRIDYVLASPELYPRIQSIERVAAAGDGIRLSDHLGLVVTLNDRPP